MRVATWRDRAASLAWRRQPLRQHVEDLPLPVELRHLDIQRGGGRAPALEIRRRLLARGSHYISTTRLGGRRWLRLALMSPSTEMDDVRHLAAEVLAHRMAVLREIEAGTIAMAGAG